MYFFNLGTATVTLNTCDADGETVLCLASIQKVVESRLRRANRDGSGGVAGSTLNSMVGFRA
jgi:pyrimidine deaminase RibD-like protein